MGNSERLSHAAEGAMRQKPVAATSRPSIMTSPDGTRWRAEDRPCPVCRSWGTKRLGARGGPAHRDHKGVTTDVVQCLQCSIIYAKPTLIPETNPYATQTAEEYFHSHDSQRKTARGESIAAFAENVLNRKGKMLELACGRGELLVGAANRGWTAYAVEMTEGFARVAERKGVEVECCSIEESKLLDQAQTYDVILLSAILEHLYDPIETLQRVHKALRPGGLVFIDVPNELSLKTRIGNLYMRARRRDWTVQLSPTFPPFHVVGFSPSSLTHVLNSTGFRIYKLDVPKWSNALPEGKSIVRKMEKWGVGAVQSIGARMGMGDGVVCWAVRD